MLPTGNISMVIETLKPVDPDRRCYHQIGGVLAERTVKEVLPVLEVCISTDPSIWR